MLRLIIALFIFCNLSSAFSQVPPSGELPYRDGKIYYAFNYIINKQSFTNSVKQPLLQYSSTVNQHIKNPLHQMTNYLLLDDSSRIIANIKFVITANPAALYEGVASFTSLKDSVNVTLYDVTLVESSLRTDLPSVGEPAEKSDNRKNKPAMKLLGDVIEGFIGRFHGRLLTDN